ncbi:hypothetical protein [Marinomonas epiphytica]
MIRVATLGPGGSNHEMVSQQYLDYIGVEHYCIELVQGFSDAVQKIKSGAVDHIIQCAAHPEVAQTLGLNQGLLYVIDTFIAPGKPLGILTRRDIASPVSIAFHPATRSYADLSAWPEQFEEQSTVAVAQGLLSGQYDSGIAALEVAEQNSDQLKVDAVIETIDDAWLVYGTTRVCTNGVLAWPHSPGAKMLRR